MKKYLIISGIFFSLTANVNAANFTAQQIYWYAKNNNSTALYYANNIDVTDKNGNTAYCLALKDKDQQSADLLTYYGADKNSSCVSKISGKDTFLGMGAAGWTVVGLAAVGGGVALAAGGGGGGSSGSSSSDNKNDSTTTKLDCVHGTQSGKVCVCQTGYTGTLCDSLADGYIEIDGNVYPKLDCQNGGTQTGAACSCPTGYTGTLCDSCTQYYEKNAAGECVLKSPEIIGTENPINNSIINIDSKDAQTVYGMNILNGIEAEGFLSKYYYGANAFEDNGEIFINNTGNNDIYGIMGSSSESGKNLGIKNSYSHATGNITISNNGSGNIYGMYNLTSLGNSANSHYYSTGTISIENYGNGNIYGIYGKNKGVNAYFNSNGIISIDNHGNGNIYGIKAQSGCNVMYSDGGDGTIGDYTNDLGIIKITNDGNGKSYGIYADDRSYNVGNQFYIIQTRYVSTSKSIISIVNKGNGNIYGLYGKNSWNNVFIDDYYSSKNLIGTISLANMGDGLSIGIYGENSYNYSYDKFNQGNKIVGTVKIHNLGNGVAIGMYGNGGTVENSGDIIITRADFTDDNLTENDTSDDTTYSAATSKGGTAIGIYGASGTTIKNNGTITIDGSEKAYGIWAEDSTVKVYNYGTITIDGTSCTECQNTANAIVLNGGKLFQDGEFISDVIDLSAIDGTVLATQNSKFVSKNAISGELVMSSDIVNQGFQTSYTTSNTIDSADTKDLKLSSQSALFNASLAENGHDVNLTMKSFDEVVKNKSLANFLQNNYAAQNNENLFSSLKSLENVKQLNNGLNDFAGKDLFGRMAFEDLTMLRELNFDMKQKMSGNDNEYFSFNGSTAPFAFDGDSGSNNRWAMTGHKDGKRSYAFGFAFSDINSNDGSSHNNRNEKMFQVSLPLSYQTNGFNLTSAPQIGYSYGNYNRKGFDNSDYKGTVSKQMFGLLNEARYPLQFGGWTVAPSAEFNVVNYRLKGSETDYQPFALRLKSQNNYSVETGFGLYADKNIQLAKESSLKLNGGVAMYHEFANPYALTLGMNEMDGSFTVRDEKRTDNRAVVRTGFEFTQGKLSLLGNLMSYIDSEYRTNATLDLKYNF